MHWNAKADKNPYAPIPHQKSPGDNKDKIMPIIEATSMKTKLKKIYRKKTKK